MLDVNIPEVTQMYDQLDLKYERIKKLKEEFKEIKSQFGIPAQPPMAKNNTEAYTTKRYELKTRGSMNNPRLSIDDTSTKNESVERH